MPAEFMVKGDAVLTTECCLISRSFAEKSGLLTPRLMEILSACDAKCVMASMTMLGEGIFACGKDAKSVLSEFGEVYTLSVSKTGPVILEDSYV